MAKTETVDSPDFEIEMYRPDESGARYEAHVQALIAADANRSEEQITSGFHASIKVTFPKEEAGKPAIEKHKRWFRESARAHKLSAKIVEEIDAEGSTVFRYIVVPQIDRPRKPKAVDTPADDSDVPTATTEPVAA